MRTVRTDVAVIGAGTAGLAAYHRGWLPEPVAAYFATRRILRGMA